MLFNASLLLLRDFGLLRDGDDDDSGEWGERGGNEGEVGGRRLVDIVAFFVLFFLINSFRLLIRARGGVPDFTEDAPMDVTDSEDSNMEA